MALAMKISDALEGFVLQLDANGRSVHTRAQYVRHVKMLVAVLGDVEVGTVDHVAVARFLTSKEVRGRRGGGPRKATSANGLRSSLRVFFAWVHAVGYAPRNAAALVQRARCGPRPPRALSPTDQERLLAALRERDTTGRDHALFHLLLGAGLRIGSALALEVGDLDLDRGEAQLRKAKGDRPAVAILPREVCDHLRRYLDGRTAGLLFPGMGPRHANRRLKHWLREAGVEAQASPHCLRHAYASRLLTNTGDLALVQLALNHASVASTVIYARVAPERLRAALGA